VLPRVRCGEVRGVYLDIENRRAVQRIQPHDLQHMALDTPDTDGGHTDGVRPAGTAGGEHPSERSTGIASGVKLQFVAGGAVETEEYDDVAAGPQAHQALGQCRINHNAGWPGAQFLARELCIALIPFHVTDGMKGDRLGLEP